MCVSLSRFRYVCDVAKCFKPYSDWRNFQNHRKTVHLINPSVIRCDQCDAVFYKSWSYAYHVKSVHSKHLQCNYCEQTFVMERSLEAHVARKHLDEPQVASASSAAKSSGGRNSKYEHLIREYFRVESDGRFACLKCDRLITRRNNAIAHAKMMHMHVRDFVCEVCSKKFFHRGDLNTHMRLVSVADYEHGHGHNEKKKTKNKNKQSFELELKYNKYI